MTDNIHITAAIPPDADKAERRDIIAGAIDKSLRLAAADPGMRLDMIMGEALTRYRALCAWVESEIREDDAKAPGLIALALRCTGDDTRFASSKLTPFDNMTRKRLLEEAVTRLEAEAPLIEHADG